MKVFFPFEGHERWFLAAMQGKGRNLAPKTRNEGYRDTALGAKEKREYCDYPKKIFCKN